MKLFGINISKEKKDNSKVISDEEAIKILEESIKKSGSTFDRLWLKAKDFSGMSSFSPKPYATVSSVYKPVKAICDNASQSVPAFYDKKTGKELTSGDSVSELKALFENPNDRQSFSDFIQEWVGFYCLYGEGFIHKIQSIGNVTGRISIPLGLEVFNPEYMKEQVDNLTKRIAFWRYIDSQFSVDEIIHTKDFNPYNFYRGQKPLSAILDEIAIDEKSLEYNLNFFLNDATPNAILSSEKNLTEEQKKRLIDWWDSKHRGAGNSFRPGLLEGGLKFTTISQTHKDMDFIEQKRFTREEILGIWKAPKALFNITDDLNYATFTGQMKMFWIYTIIPILRKFEDAINVHLINRINPNILFRFDLKNVPAFQEDFNQKVSTAKVLFDMGFTANEIAEKLDLGFNDESWRDEWWINGMMIPAREVMNMGFDKEDTEEEEVSGEKGFKAERTMKQLMLLKAFKGVHSQLQITYFNKLKKFFYNLRKQALSTSDADLSNGKVNIDWVKADEELKKISLPIIEAGIKAGVDIGKRYVGKSIADDILNSKLASYLVLRVDKIKDINRVTERKIKETIRVGIAEGQSTSQMAVDIISLGQKVREDLRTSFNTLSSRARTIAVTETAGAVNGGSFIYYDEVGIENKQWLTAQDEEVRESHVECEQQGEIPLHEKFQNGCMYPSDQDGGAEEVINCRCVLQPVI
ncbi:MAG TPA: phage portal protein [Candidatus Cloacimonas acidaminovorans]|nr:phage portal protein [Candidatus Cloacimonas acidaminovorans]